MNAEQPALSVAEALARIDRSDAHVRAWSYVDRDAARDAAADGPLGGMPFGVKDIIDVCGMPTRYGLPNFGVPSAPIDAWCVATLRAAGAVPVGKTHTTALAFRDPAPTRNPHHPERTPGGSSAGSAAAVGAGQVPFALATQTLGSIARPAAFCGVVGYKPTHGTIPAQGVTPQAPTLDTIGIIAADTAIAARVAAVYLPDLAYERHADPHDAPVADRHDTPVAAPRVAPRAAPRIAYAPATFADRFEPDVLAALQTASERIAAAGANVERIDLPAIVEEAIAPHWTIDMFEANAVLGPMRAYDLPPLVAAFLAEAAETTRDAYRAALAFRARSRLEIVALLERYDVMLLACANPAPARDTTGDVVPFMPWTFWGFPVLTLPVARSPEGLPIAIQLVAAPNADATLLRTAGWIERTLATALSS